MFGILGILSSENWNSLFREYINSRAPKKGSSSYCCFWLLFVAICWIAGSCLEIFWGQRSNLPQGTQCPCSSRSGLTILMPPFPSNLSLIPCAGWLEGIGVIFIGRIKNPTKKPKVRLQAILFTHLPLPQQFPVASSVKWSLYSNKVSERPSLFPSKSSLKPRREGQLSYASQWHAFSSLPHWSHSYSHSLLH